MSELYGNVVGIFVGAYNAMKRIFISNQTLTEPYHYKEVFMSLVKNIILLCLIGAFLSACGDGGLFGNTPGPKKPAWASQSPEHLAE